MFEGELIEEWEGWLFYSCIDVPYRAVQGKTCLEGKNIEGLKYRIMELKNRKPYTKEQKRNYKGVYLK